MHTAISPQLVATSKCVLSDIYLFCIYILAGNRIIVSLQAASFVSVSALSFLSVAATGARCGWRRREEPAAAPRYRGRGNTRAVGIKGWSGVWVCECVREIDRSGGAGAGASANAYRQTTAREQRRGGGGCEGKG